VLFGLLFMLGFMTSPLRNWLLGSPLPSAAQKQERLTKIKALAVFSSDALSSVAYATEEILLVLIVAGPAAMALSLPIAGTIVALIGIVTFSYYQTIHGYPNGGGAYIVAHENLGVTAGLIAAAALMLDYVLTVAVSVTAGVLAVTSALPDLGNWRVEFCLLAILLVTWANLRGVRESGTLFAIPTYLFVVVFLGLIVAGLWGVRAAEVVLVATHPPLVGAGMPALGILLILRAFASGCTALTGIEAISNGIPTFYAPESRNAGRTLVVMALLLGTLFLGITYLAHDLGIAPVEHESVVSQVARRVVGSGPSYWIIQAATALILLLAANTSYADFPRLASLLAQQGYAPRQLANVGDRLVFSNGILFLGVLASVLVLVFRGSTSALIPLYAVGVFISFTLSQLGMVQHWRKLRSRGWRWKAMVNGLGGTVTALVLIVIVESKLLSGAWAVLLLIPALYWSFCRIHQHYLRADQLLARLDSDTGWQRDASPDSDMRVVVPVVRLHEGALAALRFATKLSSNVSAVVVDNDPVATAQLQASWTNAGVDVPLIHLPAPYRGVVEPILQYLDELDAGQSSGRTIVVLPEFISAKWWHFLLHNQVAVQLKTALLYDRHHHGGERIIVDVPYRLPN
jgi:amino acid transporter